MYILRAIFDFLFPRHCVMCGERLDLDEEVICDPCIKDIPRTRQWENPEKNRLAMRFWGKVRTVKAVALIYFRSHTQTAEAVYAFKYHNQPFVATYMGRLMAKEISPSGFFDDIDCLVPVPLNSRRLSKRGYNQSEMLAKGIAQVTGLPIVNNAVKRRKNTGTQTRLTRFERAENMFNTFELTEHATILEGKHCLVIDDIITTGSTTIGCVAEIEKIRGARTSVLSLGCTKK